MIHTLDTKVILSFSLQRRQQITLNSRPPILRNRHNYRNEFIKLSQKSVILNCAVFSRLLQTAAQSTADRKNLNRMQQKKLMINGSLQNSRFALSYHCLFNVKKNIKRILSINISLLLLLIALFSCQNKKTNTVKIESNETKVYYKNESIQLLMHRKYDDEPATTSKNQINYFSKYHRKPTSYLNVNTTTKNLPQSSHRKGKFIYMQRITIP